MNCDFHNPFEYVQKPYDPTQYQSARSPTDSEKSLGKVLNHPQRPLVEEHELQSKEKANFHPVFEMSYQPREHDATKFEKGKRMFNLGGSFHKCPESRPILKDRWISENSSTYVRFGQHPSVCPRNCNIDPKLIFIHNYDAQDPLRNGERISYDHMMECMHQQQLRRKKILEESACTCGQNNYCTIHNLFSSPSNGANSYTQDVSQMRKHNCQCDEPSYMIEHPQANEFINYIPKQMEGSVHCNHHQAFTPGNQNYTPKSGSYKSMYTQNKCAQTGKLNVTNTCHNIEEVDHPKEQVKADRLEDVDDQIGPNFHNFGRNNTQPTVDSHLMKTHNVSHGNLNESYPFAKERRERISKYENQRHQKDTTPPKKKPESTSRNKKLVKNVSKPSTKPSINSKAQKKATKKVRESQTTSQTKVTRKDKSQNPQLPIDVEEEGVNVPPGYYARRETLRREAQSSVPDKIYNNCNYGNHNISHHQRECVANEFLSPHQLCNHTQVRENEPQRAILPQSHDLSYTLGGKKGAKDSDPVVFSQRPACCHVTSAVRNNYNRLLVDPRNDPKNYAGLPAQYTAFIKPAGEKTEWSLRVSDCLHMFD